MSKYSDYQKHEPIRGVGAAPEGLLEPTSPDITGPFYLPDAPFRNRLCTIENLILKGVVKDQHGDPIRDAVLDFWQANKDGAYDEKGFGFRGKQQVDGTDIEPGGYELYTIKPGNYEIGVKDGKKEVRCSHIHVIVSAPGFRTLTTQLYFPDDPFNATDRWFDPKRVVHAGALDPVERFFNFVLARDEVM